MITNVLPPFYGSQCTTHIHTQGTMYINYTASINCNRHSVFGFLSAFNSSTDGDVSADRFNADVLSQAFIMLALADDLRGFVSCFLHISPQHMYTDYIRYMVTKLLTNTRKTVAQAL